MKHSIAKFFELVEADKKKRKALQEEIDALVKKEMEFGAVAAVASSSGDAEGYIAAKAERQKVADTIFVKRSYLDNFPKAASEKEAFEAWSDYSADYNANLKKALTEFYKEREKLCGMYSGLIDMQYIALATRESFAEAAGINKETLDMEFIPLRSGIDKGLLRLANFPSMDTDLTYYMACHSIEHDRYYSERGERDPEEQRVFAVVLNHTSK